MTRKITVVLLGTLVVISAIAAILFVQTRSSPHRWTEAEVTRLRSLSLDSLPPLPPDPSNAVADDPQAVALGHQIFFDTRFSGNGQFSCATCHQPDKYFTDGLPKAQAMGTTPRHTPSIVGVAYQPWFYWDGRKDSQWAQAMAPMEAPVEQGGNRTRFAHLIAENYRDAYETLFGPLPDLSHLPADAAPVEDPDIAAAWEVMSVSDQEKVNRIFANVGKVLAAYERQILPGRSRFDDYAVAVAAGDQERMAELFTADEAAGLRLFIGEANCTDCHNGPLLTNGTFHNIGLPLDGTNLDPGRFEGVRQVVDDPFNCLGPFSDAVESDCGETRFAKTEGQELVGAFKTPSLRNVANTAPYMHTGAFPDLATVLAHYNTAPPAFPGHSDLTPLGFEQQQIEQIIAFLHTLSAEPNAPDELLEESQLVQSKRSQSQSAKPSQTRKVWRRAATPY